MAPVRKGSAMSSVAVTVTTVTICLFCYYSHSVYRFTHHLQACTSDPSNKFRRRWGVEAGLISTCNRETKAQRVCSICPGSLEDTLGRWVLRGIEVGD